MKKSRPIFFLTIILLLTSFSIGKTETFQTQVPQNPAFTIRVDENNKVTITPDKIPVKLQRLDQWDFCTKMDAAGVALFPGTQPEITNRGLGDLNMQYYSVNRINIGQVGKGLCSFYFNDATTWISLPINPPVNPNKPGNQANFEAKIVAECNKRDRSQPWSVIINTELLRSTSGNAKTAFSSDVWWWTTADIKPWVRKSNGTMEWRNFEGSPYPQGVMPISTKLVCDAIVCAPFNSYPSATLPVAFVGMPIQNIQLFSGGRKPLKITEPNAASPLPPGLTLSESGILSGTPAKEGKYTFNLLVWDTCPTGAKSVLKTYNLTVYKRQPPVISSISYTPLELHSSGGQIAVQANITDAIGVNGAIARFVDSNRKVLDVKMSLNQGTAQNGIWKCIAQLPANQTTEPMRYRVEVTAQNAINITATGNGVPTISVSGLPRPPIKPPASNPAGTLSAPVKNPYPQPPVPIKR